MAQPNLEFFKTRALLLKLEATEGTDAAPVPATDAFQCMNGKAEIVFDKITRTVDRTFFAGDTVGVTNSRATIDGDFELVPPTNPGVGAAAVDALLKIAGMAKVLDGVLFTTRYNPISLAIPTATGYWYQAATLRKALAARANITGLSLAVGAWFKATTHIEGQCAAVTEVALPTGLVYTPFITPVFATQANTTLLIGVADVTPTLHLWGKELSVDFGSALKTTMYTEKQFSRITDRNPQFKLRCARPAKADFDAWALMLAGSPICAQFRLSQTGPLYSEIGIRGQIEKVSEVDIDGDYGIELSGSCVASNTGGDEFYIKFGTTT
jgi:hypothetical protein